MNKTKYFLVGMPASGKSTIGKLVARQLGLEFIDLDNLIVDHEGMTLNEISVQNENSSVEYHRQTETTRY